MAADALAFPAGAIENLADGTNDLDTNTHRLDAYTSSYVTSTATHSTTNQVATANGYTRDNYALTSVTWAESGGTATFDAADFAPMFTASGGSVVFRYLQVWDDTDASDSVIGYILADNAPADITVSDTSDLNVTWNASGIFTIS